MSPSAVRPIWTPKPFWQPPSAGEVGLAFVMRLSTRLAEPPCVIRTLLTSCVLQYAVSGCGPVIVNDANETFSAPTTRTRSTEPV